MKRHLIGIAAVLVSFLIYAVGMTSFQRYDKLVDESGWNLEVVVHLLIAVVIVTAPVMNSWEAKARRWFGLEPKPEKKEDSDQ